MASARKIGHRIGRYKGKLIWQGPVADIDHSGNAHVNQFIHGRAEGPMHVPEALTMARAQLPEARRWYAEELRAVAHLADERVVDAFATVPRERFVGPGRHRAVLHLAIWSTPDADPRHLYPRQTCWWRSTTA